jgi:3-isopropylmalate/(R)-2-methylmalate dehydratase small subunit
MGLPCVTASEADVAALMAAVEEDPAHELALDLEKMSASYRGASYRIEMPAGSREQLLDGTWDATRVLLSAAEDVKRTASRLPYVSGFGRQA